MQGGGPDDATGKWVWAEREVDSMLMTSCDAT